MTRPHSIAGHSAWLRSSRGWEATDNPRERAASVGPLPDPEIRVSENSHVLAAEHTARPSLRDELRDLGLVGQMWTLTVIAFCIARAAVVWPVLETHNVNPWWFLAIDVGTSPAYGLGQAMGVKLIRDEDRPMRDAVPWIVMLFVSFVAPYAYLLASAGKLPSYVVVGVVAWMVVFGGLAAARMVRECRVGAQCADLEPTPEAVAA